MPANSTVDLKGKKTVSIMTTDHENDRFTVMLACLGNGTKLSPPLPMCVEAKNSTKRFSAATGHTCSRSSQRVDGRIN